MPEDKMDAKKERRVRAGVGILIILGFFILLLTIWQYPKYLRAPFAKYGQERGLWKSSEEQELEKLMALKEKDTDQDGLSDFNELHLYDTSPYLEDSDSDGFSDKEEIASGNDPNCPAGKTCPKIAEEGAAKVSPSPEELISGLPGGLGGLLSGTSSAEEVRESLRQAGVNEDILKSLDDRALMDLYGETLKEMGLTGIGVNANTNTNTNTNTSNSDFDNLTPDQIREILKQQGVDEAILNSVDDETLMQIFEEAMK